MMDGRGNEARDEEKMGYVCRCGSLRKNAAVVVCRNGMKRKDDEEKKRGWVSQLILLLRVMGRKEKEGRTAHLLSDTTTSPKLRQEWLQGRDVEEGKQ